MPDQRRAAPVNPFIIALLVSFGTFMEVLDSNALSVTLPQLAGNLAVSTEESDWVINSYLVANAAIMPISAWGAARFGRKRFYLFCVFAFTVASFLCGMAWSLESLVFFRVLQGMAAAGNAASEASIIADAFPPEKRGMGFAIYGLSIVVAPTVGPTFGGWVADEYSWRWIFYSNIPIGIAAFVLSAWLIQDTAASRETTRRTRRRGWRLDWMGFGLAVVGLGSLQLFLDKGQQEDWFYSKGITVAFALAVVCLLTLPVWELTRRNPILDFTLFKSANFSAVFAAFAVTGLLTYGPTTLLPLMLQRSFGYPAMTAGLALSIGGLVTLFLTPIVGIMSEKVRPIWLIGIGFAMSAVSLFLMSGFYEGVDFWRVSWYAALQTAALAFLFVPLQAQAFAGLPARLTDQASALITLSRNVGGSIGTALGITILERRTQYHLSVLSESATPTNRNWEGWRAALDAIGLAENPTTQNAILAETVQRQATMLAFNDVFFMYFLAVIIGAPVIIFIRGRPRPQ